MIPLNAQILGIGPMLPLIAAGIGAWVLPGPWAVLAVQLAIVWGALVLAFAGGVRRGFGFGREEASTPVAIAGSLAYFVIAGLALVVPRAAMALALLIVGYALVALLDRRAALAGNAPAFFATLRPPQFLAGAAGMAGCWAWLMS